MHDIPDSILEAALMVRDAVLNAAHAQREAVIAKVGDSNAGFFAATEGMWQAAAILLAVAMEKFPDREERLAVLPQKIGVKLASSVREHWKALAERRKRLGDERDQATVH